MHKLLVRVQDLAAGRAALVSLFAVVWCHAMASRPVFDILETQKPQSVGAFF